MNNTLTIEGLFEGRIFRVPDYQRGYAWESQQRTEFLEDLDILGVGREHYTGTIVLHERDPDARRLGSDGKSFGVVDVVDGQQRLATVVLLLDSIRRELAALETEATKRLAGGIQWAYIAATDLAGQPLYKLSLNTDCDHYFKTVALSDQPGPEGPQITSERRLAEASKEFREHLESNRASRKDGYTGWLIELHQKIAHGLRVTLYQVESAAEVGVIFEVMNNRGKPLSELEKVKNFLLYSGSTLNLPHELDNAVNDAWAEIFRQLMAAGLTASSDEDQLLRAHWLTGYDPQPRKWAGSKAVKSRFDLRRNRDQALLLGDLLKYTESLRASCIGYCDARAPERPDSFSSVPQASLREEVRKWSAKLVRTNVVAPFLPLLIATRIRFADDGQKYLELVKFCEAFAFRVYRLLERRADAGQADLFRIGNQLHGGAISFDQAMRQLRSTLQAFAPDTWFDTALRREEYDWYSWAGLKYFLYEYEEHLAASKGATPKVPWDVVRRRERADTIEHILPQTPKNACWFERFDEAECRVYTHDLGNLCLTKDNSSYGNKCFAQKQGTPGSGKTCYAESSFFSERELGSLPDWDVNELKSRRARLIDWALGRWRVDLPAPDAGVPSDPGQPRDTPDPLDEDMAFDEDELSSDPEPESGATKNVDLL